MNSEWMQDEVLRSLWVRGDHPSPTGLGFKLLESVVVGVLERNAEPQPSLVVCVFVWLCIEVDPALGSLQKEGHNSEKIESLKCVCVASSKWFQIKRNTLTWLHEVFQTVIDFSSSLCCLVWPTSGSTPKRTQWWGQSMDQRKHVTGYWAL